ncbi:hypothetical protein H072_7791 [Dactylellina haptotyla CBS 200.50]|uniref:Uncharacterized protein n=1 Tax=Dactylellina haptotyla (strain CBS 200.50) TaxID=1284197 RepID=S8A6L0_DACHA|nr:hypothetical protein H072_7791 [Dactylellina haptotyla CBS 200.50]
MAQIPNVLQPDTSAHGAPHVGQHAEQEHEQTGDIDGARQTTLPPELLRMIFQYAKQVVKQDFLRLNEIENYSLQILFNRLRSARVQVINISNAIFLGSDTLARLQECLVNPHTVSTQIHTTYSSDSEVSCWSNLRSLTIRYTNFTRSWCTPLNSLSELLYGNHATLKSLSVELHTVETEDHSMGIPALIESLQETSGHISDPELFRNTIRQVLVEEKTPLPPNLPILQQLRFSGVPELPMFYNMAGEDFIQLQFLRVLHIVDCSGVDGLLEQISDKLVSLKSLALLHSCYWDSIKQVIPNLPPLHSLLLSIPRHTHEEIRDITFYDITKKHERTLRSLSLQVDEHYFAGGSFGDAFNRWLNKGETTIEERLCDLQELSISVPNYIMDVPVFPSLRILRIVGDIDHFESDELFGEVAVLEKYMKDVTRAGDPSKHKCNPSLELVVFGESCENFGGIHIPKYFLTEYMVNRIGELRPVISPVKFRKVQELFPNSPILDYDVKEWVWSEV